MRNSSAEKPFWLDACRPFHADFLSKGILPGLSVPRDTQPCLGRRSQMVGEIERNRCSRRSDPASPGTRRRGAGQRANRPAPGVRARKRATARTGTPDGFFSAFGDLHQRPRDARRRSSKDDSRHRDRTRLGLDCGGLLQSQWLQPESIPACGKHHQKDGGPVSLSVHVPGLKPGAEAGS